MVHVPYGLLGHLRWQKQKGRVIRGKTFKKNIELATTAWKRNKFHSRLGHTETRAQRGFRRLEAKPGQKPGKTQKRIIYLSSTMSWHPYYHLYLFATTPAVFIAAEL